MSTSLSIFILIAIFYILVGLRYLYRVVTRWSSLWDDELTDEDTKLAAAAAFYLLIPVAVALHELGHAVAIWSLGMKVEGFIFFGYMGAVFHVPTTAEGNFIIAAAGNLVTLLLGTACLVFPLRWPGHPVRNILSIELGRQSLVLVLVFYPLICIGFDGDFRTIYNFGRTPLASTLALVVHAAAIGIGYRILWKKRWRPRARLLCSALAPQLVRAEARLREAPDDIAAHRELGVLYVAANEADHALAHLEHVITAGRADAKLRLAYGTLLAQKGRFREAAQHLEPALDGLMRPEDRRAAMVVLGSVKVASGDAEGALQLADRLRSEHPDDVEAAIVWAQAAATLGRKTEAKEALLAHTGTADEEQRRKIEHLLRKIPYMPSQRSE